MKSVEFGVFTILVPDDLNVMAVRKAIVRGELAHTYDLLEHIANKSRQSQSGGTKEKA